ncbi:MAG: hypothetical protein LBQ01_10000 [Prevotellaceae bacterium]|nr:hypothetical protein [Prevotellaceae bacterium]
MLKNSPGNYFEMTATKTYLCETERIMTPVEKCGDEAIRDGSSLQIAVSYRN